MTDTVKKENYVRLIKPKQKAVVFDLDGTLVDFKRIDKQIIKELFQNNIFIKTIDMLLWCLNDIEIMPNNAKLFNIRLFVYSFFSRNSYDKLRLLYEKIYVREVEAELIKKRRVIAKIKNSGYEVFIISNNPLSKKVNSHEYNIIVANNSKCEEIKKIMGLFDVKYIIGNNYCDDILVAKKLKISPIYVGKSLIVKFLSNRKKKFLYCDLCNIKELIKKK
jgi:FMN phosphatase YigB (HAD superfamily)